MSKIKKWDEIHGEYVEDEVSVTDSEEVAGTGPSISRNPMKGIEDMVEQNDNNLDGVINNVQADPMTGALEIPKEDKKSVLEKLKEQQQVPRPVPEQTEPKPSCLCPFERELV